MPTTRRSSGLHGSQKTPSIQKTLSFSNSSKISKASTPSSLKNKSPLSQALPLKEQLSKDPTSSLPSPPASSPHLPTKSVPKPKPKTKTTLETQQRALASQITDAKIRKYWREREALRLARRVHQGGLEIGEKVLREWDCMSQFGVCYTSFLLFVLKRFSCFFPFPPFFPASAIDHYSC